MTIFIKVRVSIISIKKLAGTPLSVPHLRHSSNSCYSTTKSSNDWSIYSFIVSMKNIKWECHLPAGFGSISTLDTLCLR